MYGIFMESLVMLQNYAGNRLWPVLYLAAFVYLLLSEQSKKNRFLILYAPAVVLVLFLFPVTRKVYVALMDEGETYYRLLWMVPAGVTVAYAASKLIARHTRTGLAVCAALILFCGSNVYRSVHISPAENLYHLPQTVINLCADMVPEEADGRTYAAFPGELVHYVRQYDTRIILPFGREMIEPVWDHWNLIYTAMEEDEVIDMEHLTKLLREGGFDHLVLRADRKTDAPPDAFGFKKTKETDGYCVYTDTENTVP